MTYALIFFLLAIVATLEFVAWQLHRRVPTLKKERANLHERYGAIENVHAEEAAVQADIRDLQKLRQQLESETAARRSATEKEYADAVSKRDAMSKEIAALEENLDDISSGLYQ